MQTSDPDLVIKLSEEEPPDPSVITAAQGITGPLLAQSRSVHDLWGGCERRLRDPFSTPYDPRKRMLGRAEYYDSPKTVSVTI